jgi:hypothetical protein
MKEKAFSLEDAIKFVGKSRPQISPNSGFMEQLSKFEQQELRQNGEDGAKIVRAAVEVASDSGKM